jgi:DNA polymerase I-like protein with 3'-5' exonuclease and polymerase domains
MPVKTLAQYLTLILGVCIQVHDELVFEVRENDVEQVHCIISLET